MYYKMYIIKYFSQYTQPSVGLTCHFIQYNEASVSGLTEWCTNSGVQSLYLCNILLGL